MKSLVTILILSTVLITRAQEIAWSVLYDFKTKSAVPVMGTTLSKLPNFLGWTGKDAELWALVGYDSQQSQGTLGSAVVMPFRFAENATLWAGGFGRITPKQPASFGIVVGVRIEVR